MKLPAFLPEDLRQLLRFVPLSGWDAVEWLPLMGSLRSLSWQYATGSGVRPLARRTSEAVPAVRIVSRLKAAASLEELESEAQRQRAGDDLLRLYFGQWLVDEGLFLDLRAARVGWSEDGLHFAPNGLWIRLRPEFREGMLALYRSFYSDDEQAFVSALAQMGMLHEGLDEGSREELIGLLKSHFGVQQSAQFFAIDAFKSSFDALFEFFTRHDYKLHSDFVFVGFYLITLYLTLEKGGRAHDVRAICAEMLT